MANITERQWKVFEYLAGWSLEKRRNKASSLEVFRYAKKKRTALAYENIHTELNNLTKKSKGYLVVKSHLPQPEKKKGKVHPRVGFSLNAIPLKRFYDTLGIDPDNFFADSVLRDVCYFDTLYKGFIKNPKAFKDALKRGDEILKKSGIRRKENRTNFLMSSILFMELLADTENRLMPNIEDYEAALHSRLTPLKIGLRAELRDVTNEIRDKIEKHKKEAKRKERKGNLTPTLHARARPEGEELHSSFSHLHDSLIKEHIKSPFLPENERWKGKN